MTFDEAWSLLINCGVATPYELATVCHLVGHDIEILAKILKTRTGYTDLKKFAEDYENGNY